MIAKVVHGWRPGGLIAYLLGPGVAEVHRRPRVIASWDGLDAGWQPERTGPSEYDLRLGPLIDALHAPAVAAGLPTRTPDGDGRGYVWHCSVRLADSDRVLDDEQWAGIARELLDWAGVAVAGDAGGPRWVAVRHADDHIHIAAVLVRQDTLRRFWPRDGGVLIRASKTDQDARGAVAAVPRGSHPETDPVRLVREWRSILARGRACRRTPLATPSGPPRCVRSCRRPRATARTVSAIAAHGRWSPASPVVLGYVRSVDRWRDNPMRSVGL